MNRRRNINRAVLLNRPVLRAGRDINNRPYIKSALIICIWLDYSFLEDFVYITGIKQILDFVAGVQTPTTQRVHPTLLQSPCLLRTAGHIVFNKLSQVCINTSIVSRPPHRQVK